MDGDLGILTAAVRDWSGRTLPGDSGAADAAERAALSAVADGASVREAYGAAQRFLRAWAAHPARSRGGHRRLPAAS